MISKLIIAVFVTLISVVLSCAIACVLALGIMVAYNASVPTLVASAPTLTFIPTLALVLLVVLVKAVVFGKEAATVTSK